MIIRMRKAQRHRGEGRREIGKRIAAKRHKSTKRLSRLLCLFVAIPLTFSPLFYCSRAVMFLLGTCPTGMRVTSFIAFRSMTETEFDWAFAT